MKRAIRLLAIDIDGTLLDSRFQVSDANRRAIAAAYNMGISVILVTGRRYSVARPIAAELALPLVLFSSNGAVVKGSNGTTLDRQLLPQESARLVLGATRTYRRYTALFFDREGAGQIMTEDLDRGHLPLSRYMERNRGYIVQVDNLEALTEDPIQVLFIGPAVVMNRIYSLLASSPWAVSVGLSRTEYLERDLSLVDVLARGCNKGAALARYAAKNGIRREEIMAIGDNWNDVQMLELAGLPVLMGNSSDELKQSGWAVTSSNDEDGVAQAIRKYVLDRAT